MSRTRIEPRENHEKTIDKEMNSLLTPSSVVQSWLYFLTIYIHLQPLCTYFAMSIKIHTFFLKAGKYASSKTHFQIISCQPQFVYCQNKLLYRHNPMFVSSHIKLEWAQMIYLTPTLALRFNSLRNIHLYCCCFLLTTLIHLF